MIMTFMEKLADTYMLNRVRLSNDMIGKIVFINKQAVSRPVVKCGETFIDLSKETDITIAEIIQLNLDLTQKSRELRLFYFLYFIFSNYHKRGKIIDICTFYGGSYGIYTFTRSYGIQFVRRFQ